MAFNRKTFLTRTLTSVLFVAVMLAGLLINNWTFFLLFSIIHFGCWIEYQRLIGLIDKDYQLINPFHKYGIMIAGWSIMLYFTNDTFNILGLRLHELGWWTGLLFVFLLPVMEVVFTRHIQLKNIGYSALGLLYISLSCGLMIDLGSFIRQVFYQNDLIVSFYSFSYFTALIPLVIIFSLWVNDTMAYLVGSLIGKHPLSKISPNKTWEGTLGGIILSIVATGLFFSNIQTDIAVPGYHFWFSDETWYIIAGISAIAGTFGDLLESKLKRIAGVKDTGAIFPGHGGFLDRFDSMLMAIPFVWAYIQLSVF